MTKRIASSNAILGIAWISVAVAVGLSGLQAYAEDAQVLPAGRSRLSFDFVQTTPISQEYNSAGNPESIAAPYNIELSGSNIQTVSPEMGNLVSYLNNTGYYYHPSQSGSPLTAISQNPNGGIPLGNWVAPGALGVGGQAEQQRYVMSYFYGVTDRLTIGLVAPMVNTNVNVIAGIGGANTAATAYQFLSANSGFAQNPYMAGLQTLAQLSTGNLQQALQADGYNTFGNYSGGGLGDAVLGARYNYFNTHLRRDHDLLSSFQAGLTLPTGIVKNPANITQVSTGMGAFALGAANIVNYSPWHFLTLSNGVHYNHYLPTSEQFRVPSGPADILPSAAEQENGRIQYGDDASTDFGAKFSITQALSIEPAYVFAWHFQDNYSGQLQGDYSSLSYNTNTFLETAQVSINFTTRPAFFKYEFPLPIDFATTLNVPTQGRNVIIAPYVTEEIALYF